MDTELVSIALTTYNGEKYLRDQLDSIYNQNYENIEVVVTDDCSTDNTVPILEEYHQKYGLQYVVNEKNLGFTKNFEKTVSLCSGAFIALADQDDVWLPEKIEILQGGIGSYSLICSDAKLIDENGRLIFHSLKEYMKLPAQTGKPFQLLLFHPFVTGCTVLIKRELLAKALPIPEGGTFHDWWFALVASKLNGIRYLNKQLVLYRQHSSNLAGVIRRESNAKLLFRLLLNPVGEKRRRSNYIKKIGKKQIWRLNAIKTHHVFTPKEKRTINDAITYYSDLFSSIHNRRFRLAMKYRKALYPNTGYFQRIALIIFRFFMKV